MAAPVIVWFRRDLRLRDHAALIAARATARPLLALFVLDPKLISASGAPRLAFLYRSLRALNESLDGRLVVRFGDPVEVVVALAGQVVAEQVFVSRDFGPYGRERDAAVAAGLRSISSRLVGVGSPYAVQPASVFKGDGSPYAVFTPFKRTWLTQLRTARPDGDDVRLSPMVTIESQDIPDDPDLGDGCELPPAGEAAAHQRWEAFRDDSLAAYDERRNDPAAIGGTSGLSPYLRWGQIHPLQVLRELGGSRADEVFRSELAWRDFYADVLFHQPRSARHNLNPRFDRLANDDGPQARQRFQLWARGLTGYPIVDAGMRQMLATGWMHNRVRMITASFLVKDLHLPWQWGARHFMQHLVDGDLASNQHGWQWTAGSGTDAAPYFRVFNPVLQGGKFDPTGAYVRRWVPELAEVADRFVHAPWESPTHDLASYRPMVDHSAERNETLRRYQQAMGR